MVLGDSDKKFETVFRCSPHPFILSTITKGRYIAVNDAFVQKTGWARQDAIGRTTVELKIWENPAERGRLVERMLNGQNISNLECRFRKKSGEVFVALLSAEPIDINGEPCAVSNLIDITEWRHTQDALADMGRKLMEAHEEERTFIARELHDDVCQRMALLVVELQQLTPHVRKAGLASHAHLCQRLFELSKDIQALSHRLHSSKLEYLGLVVAARSFCREVSDQQKVQIEFIHEDLPNDLPKAISLNLFRILQESLQNAVKYSGVRRFEVKLFATAEEIGLSVQDSGRGFDPHSEMVGKGLGLVSMYERARMINGDLRIESRPNGGTTVTVRAPLHLESQLEASRYN